MTTPRTPWYPGKIKPVRVGWYEVKRSSAIGVDYWDGTNWCWTPNECASFIPYIGPEQNALPWRGLMWEVLE